MFSNEAGELAPMSKRCGTPPYVAPEIITQASYSGPFCDLWSCGVVLYVMLSGMIPWDLPTDACWEFSRVRQGQFDFDPWTRFSANARDLLARLLCMTPSERLLAEQASSHAWLASARPENESPSAPRKRKRSSSQDSSPDEAIEARVQLLVLDDSPLAFKGPSPKRICPSSPSRLRPASVSFTQPRGSHVGRVDSLDLARGRDALTQPLANFADDDVNSSDSRSVLVSPAPGTQPTRLARFDATVGQITRFASRLVASELHAVLLRVLSELGVRFQVCAHDATRIDASTLDRRRGELAFRIRLFALSPEQRLVHFMRTRGMGGEFMRLFAKVRDQVLAAASERP